MPGRGIMNGDWWAIGSGRQVLAASMIDESFILYGDQRTAPVLRQERNIYLTHPTLQLLTPATYLKQIPIYHSSLFILKGTCFSARLCRGCWLTISSEERTPNWTSLTLRTGVEYANWWPSMMSGVSKCLCSLFHLRCGSKSDFQSPLCQRRFILHLILLRNI